MPGVRGLPGPLGPNLAAHRGALDQLYLTARNPLLNNKTVVGWRGRVEVGQGAERESRLLLETGAAPPGGGPILRGGEGCRGALEPRRTWGTAGPAVRYAGFRHTQTD